jgi:hypothetical protein
MNRPPMSQLRPASRRRVLELLANSRDGYTPSTS